MTTPTSTYEDVIVAIAAHERVTGKELEYIVIDSREVWASIVHSAPMHYRAFLSPEGFHIDGRRVIKFRYLPFGVDQSSYLVFPQTTQKSSVPQVKERGG